jgi:hypothetical protein
MGFTVKLDKMTVTARRQNNETYVYTQFIYENKGASDVTIPKNFTGDVVIKTSNEESIVSTIKQSGCASTNLDDLVLKPGKNIEVNLCFLTAGTSPQPGGRVILIYRSVGDPFDFINWTIK